MKEVLVLSYSQSGQIHNILRSIIHPLLSSPDVNVEWKIIKPIPEYPFPWPFFSFINIFPETVTGQTCTLEEISFDKKSYDLIIIGYQVWYLSVSIPIYSFMKSHMANVLQNTPVITVIGCRDMWYSAHHQMQTLIHECNAYCIGNIALVDQGFKLATFITTPRWLIHGKKKGIKGLLPDAGVGKCDIQQAVKYGYTIYYHLKESDFKSNDIFHDIHCLKIDKVNEEFEAFAKKYFVFFAKLIKMKYRRPYVRKVLILFWFISLICLVVISIPCIPFLKIKYKFFKK